MQIDRPLDSSGGDLPSPDLATWRAKVEAELRGRGVDDLAWRVDGIVLGPLATRADVDGLPHLAPEVRGWLGRAGAWSVRELVVAPRPEDAARATRAALADGADAVELCFDDLARDGYEPGEDPPGHSGIAIHTLADFEAAVEGVDLAAARIGLTAGEGAVAALGFLLATADARGVPRTALRGDLDFDPIARLTLRQAGVDPDDDTVVVARHTSDRHVYDETAALVEACAATCPGIRPVALDGQLWHLCGASVVQELACTIASVVEIARECAARGVDFDALGAAATLRMQVSQEVVTEIAKLRALRLLWLRVASAFGAKTDAGLRPELHCTTSGRARAFHYDLRTNLLRTGLAAFAAVSGGCDALVVVPFDEDPGGQDDAARRLARHQQILLRDESRLGEAPDPGGGAFAVERLTDRLARAAWDEVAAIERDGGLRTVLENGSLQDRIGASADRRLDELERGERVLVGITKFVDPALDGGARGESLEYDAALDVLAERHATWLGARDDRAARAAIESVRGPAALDAYAEGARAGATLGELMRASWPEGEAFRYRFAPVALADGEEFEARRAEEEATDVSA